MLNTVLRVNLKVFSYGRWVVDIYLQFTDVLTFILLHVTEELLSWPTVRYFISLWLVKYPISSGHVAVLTSGGLVLETPIVELSSSCPWVTYDWSTVKSSRGKFILPQVNLLVFPLCLKDENVKLRYWTSLLHVQ